MYSGYIEGFELLYYDEIDSTNLEAKRLADGGRREKTAVLAGCQSAGKGRRGRKWESFKDEGIWLSLLIRPQIGLEKISQITLMTAVCVVKAVKVVCGVECEIKWPNDVLLNGRKLCGILTEMRAQAEQVDYVIVGVGINVNNEGFGEELKDIATSIKIETGLAFSKGDIIGEFLRQFNAELFAFEKNGGFDYSFYRSLCVTLGRRVRVIGSDSFNAMALDITKDGELLVKKDDGSTVTVLSGEVSIR